MKLKDIINKLRGTDAAASKPEIVSTYQIGDSVKIDGFKTGRIDHVKVVDGVEKYSVFHPSFGQYSHDVTVDRLTPIGR